ncbi:hypothetical protein ACIKTA_12275, partial [Hansschlegelia beijingensis]
MTGQTMRSIRFFGGGRCGVLLLLLGLALCALSAPVRADALDDALAGFTADKYDDTEKAIAALVAAAPPNGAEILAALGSGRLAYEPESRTVLVKHADGRLSLARTGEPASAEMAGKPLKTVRVNNRIRRAVEAGS